jgi:DNA topoisomerase-2
VNKIIDDYFDVRLSMYNDRKNYMISALEKELMYLSNKAKYIQENLNDTIDLRKKTKEQVVKMLEEKGYDKIGDDEEYRYLVKMPMDSVTNENVKKLLSDKGEKENELTIIKSMTPNQMWNKELDQLKSIYIDYKEERKRISLGESIKKVVKNTGKKVIKKDLLIEN